MQGPASHPVPRRWQVLIVQPCNMPPAALSPSPAASPALLQPISGWCLRVLSQQRCVLQEGVLARGAGHGGHRGHHL